MINKTSIQVANAFIDLKIENATDKRVRTALERIKLAAGALYEKNDEINTAKIGEYCENKFGKPKTQTLWNDFPKVYALCITEFERLNPVKKEVSETKKLVSSGIDRGSAVIIINLRKRVTMLENVLEKKFNSSDETGLISVDEIIKSKPVNDAVNMSDVKLSITDKQRLVIQKLLSSLIERCDPIIVKGKGNGKRIVDTSTGESLLNPSELAALLHLLPDDYEIE